MRAHKMNADLSTVPTPNIGDIAKAMGGRGRLATSAEEVRAAAAEWVANPGPMIIDARISRNAITLANRRVLYGKDE
jgi:thiamine pyrophosphate-dependent acetolactate synthase large subunit-like protein